ncbi:hypothetical protein CPB84DRAFT_1776357 [Gymnopilus junonius]|uniref:Secreted protein n=1 Tax=Gymnopilus junonius TaxID=109634 RepID=A0A9P5NQR6_GYMJU|nr:hypothetical protein CPB84DRAFT_1776357 [Gymnopilus junonius]
MSVMLAYLLALLLPLQHFFCLTNSRRPCLSRAVPRSFDTSFEGMSWSRLVCRLVGCCSCFWSTFSPVHDPSRWTPCESPTYSHP